MSYYTLVHKTVRCPMWDDDIVITAKYRFVEGNDNPYLARFSGAKCEVLENAKLPEWKRNKRLGLYRFCGIDDCPHLCNFKPEIDVRKN